ncbi:hypothetical protein OCU04_008664 [Sclerotinia nivalis]|uniref:Myb-like domain-containing protein n=1 Tax=Sclerotinia nivalis TaxID=352851 RepID=A0A9X0AM11_9HELO|nr:hypothetical protein OCU04_008664 [Sclerotinia nivalis]
MRPPHAQRTAAPSQGRANQSRFCTGNRPLILEDNESNASDAESSSVPADFVLELSKQDLSIGHGAWLNTESDGSSEDDNISLSRQDFAYTPSQEQPCYCHGSIQSSQNDIGLYTDDEIVQHRSGTSSHHNLPVPLAADNGESNKGSAFGYEVDMFPVFDEQEELLATSSLSPRLHRSAQPSHPDWEHDQSTSSHGRFEELRYGSPLHLQVGSEFREHQHQQKVTETGNNGNDDKDLQSAKRRKLPSLPADDACILTPLSSLTQSEVDETQSQGDYGYLPIPMEDNHYSPQSSRTPSVIIDPAPIAEYQEWPFKGFLNRTKIGDETTYNLEFQLQHVPKHLHYPVLSEVLNRTSTETLTPYNTLHSKIQPTKLPVKRKRIPWKAKEHKTILRMKKNGCSWKEIHNALPHRTPAAIQAQYSTKLKR